jgi:hypothetical protein
VLFECTEQTQAGPNHDDDDDDDDDDVKNITAEKNSGNLVANVIVAYKATWN